MRATAAALAVVVGIALEPSAHGESRLAAFERGPERFRRSPPSHDAPPARRSDRAHRPTTAPPRAMRRSRASHPQEPHPGSRVDLHAMHGSRRSRDGSSPAATPAARTRHAPSRVAERRLGLVRCGRPSMRRSMGWGWTRALVASSRNDDTLRLRPDACAVPCAGNATAWLDSRCSETTSRPVSA